ncbi:thiamine-phosphate kinase [Caulobacter sp. NIBR2454]|uniref:thiamine-phosphate kinase n=1 Tax=Caulobacter sp. NIBR2454 TaxID=3015996 RepID=UPI002FC3D834
MADEFETIARLLRPLTRGAPEALDLLDDAAVLPSRPGFDLILTKDALVEGVHFLSTDPLDVVARKLLRTNLSDLAAKGAEPFGYLLATAWRASDGWAEREAFAKGLALDGAAFDLRLLGGDTVSTTGPLVVSATLLGWVPTGGMVRRDGAKAGDLIVVTGTIGDGWLGLQGATGALPDPDGALTTRYRLPTPRLSLREALAHAHASADVSDGLIADVGHVARTSGLRATVDLETVPLSFAAAVWAEGRAERLATLATGGDDYEIVCAVAPERFDAFAAAAGMPVTVVGRFETGDGVEARFQGQTLALDRAGWRHGSQD